MGWGGLEKPGWMGARHCTWHSDTGAESRSGSWRWCFRQRISKDQGPAKEWASAGNQGLHVWDSVQVRLVEHQKRKSERSIRERPGKSKRWGSVISEVQQRHWTDWLSEEMWALEIILTLVIGKSIFPWLCSSSKVTLYIKSKWMVLITWIVRYSMFIPVTLICVLTSTPSLFCYFNSNSLRLNLFYFLLKYWIYAFRCCLRFIRQFK